MLPRDTFEHEVLAGQRPEVTLLRDTDGDDEDDAPAPRKKSKGGAKSLLLPTTVALSIPDLSKVIILEFQLTFATDKTMKAWAHNSIGSALKPLLSAGLVERIDAPRAEWGGADGKWRWKGGAE